MTIQRRREAGLKLTFSVRDFLSWISGKDFWTSDASLLSPYAWDQAWFPIRDSRLYLSPLKQDLQEAHRDQSCVAWSQDSLQVRAVKVHSHQFKPRATERGPPGVWSPLTWKNCPACYMRTWGLGCLRGNTFLSRKYLLRVQIATAICQKIELTWIGEPSSHSFGFLQSSSYKAYRVHSTFPLLDYATVNNSQFTDVDLRCSCLPKKTQGGFWICHRTEKGKEMWFRIISMLWVI